MGFDVRPGRAAHADGRLIEWLQMELDDSIDAPAAGQLVVAWRGESKTVGLLEHLECKPDAADGAVEELVFADVHAAADAGAHVIEYGPDGEHLHSGLPWQQERGVLRLHQAACIDRLEPTGRPSRSVAQPFLVSPKCGLSRSTRR